MSDSRFYLVKGEEHEIDEKQEVKSDELQELRSIADVDDNPEKPESRNSPTKRADELSDWPEFHEVRSSDSKPEAKSLEFETTINSEESQIKKQNVGQSSKVDELSNRPEFQEVRSPDKKRVGSHEFESTIYPIELHIKNRYLGQSSELVVEDDDDEEEGFKTPTSSEHKIQVLECPPAPRRKRSLPQTSTMIKLSSRVCRRLQFEVVEMLGPVIQDDSTSSEIESNSRLDEEE